MPDHTSHTDEELAGLSLENKRFFGELVTRYEKKLGAYVRRLGQLPQEDVQDLLQNIFIKVYQNLNDFDQSLSFNSWIYRIAHNETMTFFRSRRVRPQGHQAPMTPEMLANIASDLDVQQESEVRHDEELVRQCIDELPAHYREIVVLKYFENKRYDELSDILRLPAGTVATRLSRAKEQLKARLLAKGIGL
ncbi:MAG: sigma-70 family RNA polymerase sigma factor [Candidatus Paceibacterota bacterium]